MSKSSDIRGDIHKQMILEYITTRSLNWVGVEVKDILNYTRLRDTERHVGLSRQTVNTHLNKLVAEGEIKKSRKGRYLSTEVFDDMAYDPWGVFESNLNMVGQYIIENGDVLNLQNLANIAQTLMTKSNQPIEKFIFEIANRIGAFAVYVFIESLRSRRNVSTEDVRSVLTAEFLSKAFPLMDFLEVFLYKLPIDPKERTYFEVNESTLQKVSAAYSNIYPNLAKSLEAGYSEFCNNLLPKPNNNCGHTWEKIYLHKVGDLFLCRKCNGIDRSPEHQS
jgi:hypothetical protein